MTGRRIALAVVLAALALAACGLKGDPVRPGAEPDTEKPADQTAN